MALSHPHRTTRHRERPVLTRGCRASLVRRGSACLLPQRKRALSSRALTPLAVQQHYSFFLGLGTCNYPYFRTLRGSTLCPDADWLAGRTAADVNPA